MGLFDKLEEKIWAIRMALCCCSVFPLTIACCFCGFYWDMMVKAQEYNEEVALPAGVEKDDTTPYDICGVEVENDEVLNSKWTVLLAFNAILYLVLGSSICLLLCGTFLFPFWICGCCGITFGGCAHLAALIVTGVFRFNSEGESCAKSTAIVQPSDETFEVHGERIKALFISQCVLYICFGSCAGFMLGASG